MKTVGQQLQAGRLAKNWTPELAARETRIKLERLHDLELDCYSNFSSPAYARGFVRTYARSLGLDEYRILRQLDEDLPEDNQAALVHDSGSISYVPEPSRSAGSRVRPTAGVMIVLGLGGLLLAFAGFVLLQSYRAGILPGFGRGDERLGTNPALAVLPSDAPARAQPTSGSAPPLEAPPAPPRALPVDPHAVAVPVGTDGVAPTPTLPPAADAALLNASTRPTGVPLRALPVDPAQLVSDPPASSPVGATPSVTSSSVTPSVPVPGGDPGSSPAPSGEPDVSHARRAVAVDLSELSAAPPEPSPSVPTPGPGTAAVTAPAGDQRLILSATRDSFVQVISLDTSGPGQVLFASVIRGGQTLGFAGRKFTVNIGVPSAVKITLDGISYGPPPGAPSQPETLNLESHQP